MRGLVIEKWESACGGRFLLASIVAIHHLKDYSSLGFLGIIPRFGAFEAVLGFLLISGYSIGASYTKEPSEFVFRRIQRIWPVYLASLLLAFVVFVVEEGKYPSIWILLANILFLNQLVISSSFIEPAWSLSLEFWMRLFFNLKL